MRSFDELTRGIAHEFGHLLELMDRYLKAGDARYDQGWGNSLMGDHMNGTQGADVINELLYLYALEPGQTYNERDYDAIKYFELECHNYLRARLDAKQIQRSEYEDPSYTQKYINKMPPNIELQ